MTLIITEISEFGIAMVADSAVTQTIQFPYGITRQRTLNGARKLQIIPQLRAGISMWGLGTLEGNIPIDVWVREFIARRIYVTSLDDFADELAHELRQIAGDAKDPIGFHLAGYVERDSKKLAVAYHTRNCDGDYHHYDLHEFIAGLQFSPAILNPGELYTIRNGDYGPFAILSALSPFFLDEIKRMTKLEIPSPTLWGRTNYLVSWVKFVSDLYASAGRDRIIGGSVASLMIPPEGELVYQFG